MSNTIPLKEDLLILVDKNDQITGYEGKLKTHQLGLLHRAFSIYIFRKNKAGDTELLLQKRAKGKYHSSGLWTNTCCSHPRKNESLENATQRRLLQEFGFQCPLQYIDAFIYEAKVGALTEHEYDHIFIGHHDPENIQPNLDEIETYKWINLDILDKDLEKNPTHYTAWFKKSYEIAKQNLN